MPMLEKFLEDVRPYFRQYPFMAARPDAELDGNSILYAGTYGLLHQRLFSSYEDAGIHSLLLYKDSYLPSQPGVITRGPHKENDPQTHDDYVGMASLSYLGGSGAAKAIALHGKNHCWSFRRKGHNTIAEIFNAQFWRLPGLVQHLKLCARGEWNALDYLFWSIGVFASSFAKHGDTSGTILTWHFVRVYEQSGKKNWLCDWAVRKWKLQINSLYLNAMGDVFRIYYGPDHPFAKWALGII
jgi:hypothetical protein